MKVPAIPPSDTFRFRTRVRSRWADEDTQGVVNHATYLALIEEARHEYFGALGQVADNRFPFVIMQINARYLASSRGGEEVSVELRTMELGKSSMRQACRIRAAGDDRVLVEAEVLLVSWSLEGDRKVDLSPGMREALTRFEGGFEPAG